MQPKGKTNQKWFETIISYWRGT